MGRSPGTTASTGRPAHTERARLQGLNNISLLHSMIYLCLLECGAGPQRAVRWSPCVAAVDGAMQVPVGRQSMRVAGSRRPATVRNEALLGGSRSGRGIRWKRGLAGTPGAACPVQARPLSRLAYKNSRHHAGDPPVRPGAAAGEPAPISHMPWINVHAAREAYSAHIIAHFPLHLPSPLRRPSPWPRPAKAAELSLHRRA